MEIGVANDDESTNLFYVTLATPEALRTRRGHHPFLVEHRVLVVDDYDYRTVVHGIRQILTKCSRSNWGDSCKALQRYFQWEYEDYMGND
jgi:hypothetical protein